MKSLLLIAGLLISFICSAQVYNTEYLDGRLMFKLKSNVPIESDEIINSLPKKREPNIFVDINTYPDLEMFAEKYSITALERPSYYTGIPELMRIFRFHFSNFEEVNDIISELRSLDIVEYAEKEPIRKISFVPNDQYYGQSNYAWYLNLVNAQQAWDISLGDNAIKVAIVDNAVFCGHEDITSFMERDVADNDNDATPPQDANADFVWSHGTHCAGLATADINNGIGMNSLGGDVEVIGVKATPDNGNSNSVYHGFDGIQWACQNGADVVSLSWGSGGYDNSDQLLINSYPNVVFLAAAGNDGSTSTLYPGGYDNVICVGSVNADDSRSSFSNYNGSTQWVDLASPGGYSYNGLLNTVYTAAGNEYAFMGGTSMATPFAAGLAGLMLSLNPSLSPAEVKDCMVNTGVSINENIGPRIDAYAAMQCVQSTLTGDPMANFIADNMNITVGGMVSFTDLSNNGGNTITDWQWSFPGGSPSSFSGQTPPLITYGGIGAYDVSLTVTNTQNSDTETKSGYIVVTVEPYGGWIEQATGFSTISRGINYISLVDQNIVWATAYDGSASPVNIQEFTRTTDGGATWSPGTINLGNSALGISMIHAYNDNIAWLAAYPNAGGQTGGIWKTTDGGSSWVRQNTATYDNTASFTNVVYFWDSNNGFCQGDPINGEFELYTTNDGGASWTAVPGANIPDPISGEYGYTRQIEVVADIVWFTTNMGRIYRSTDRGLNFTVSQSPISDFGGTAANGNLSFKDGSNGLIVDNTGAVYGTSDGGVTWNPLAVTGTVFSSGLCWVEGTNIVFSTGSAGSCFSEDGGISWNPIDTEQHTAVEFSSTSTGWSGWFNESATSKGIWKWQNLSSLVAEFTGVPGIICAGEVVSFTDETTGGTPTSWTWTFAGGNPASSSMQSPQVVYDTAGNFDVSLTVDDGNGPVSKTITSYITVNDVPAQPSAIIGNTAPCYNASEVYYVDYVYGLDYLWTFPVDWTGTPASNSIQLSVGQAGTISVIPSNVCGDGSAQALIITPVLMPVADFTYADNLGTVSFTSTTVDATDFEWDFGDGNSSVEANPIHSYTSSGNYFVTLIASNSCGADTISDSVTVVFSGVKTIPDIKVNAFPNPFSQYTVVEFNRSDNQNYSILLYNSYGRIVMEVAGIRASEIRINRGDLCDGVYYYKLISNQGVMSTGKLVLVK